MTKKKILVVEDEATLHRALLEFLTSEGFEVFSALDGEEGIEITKTKKPDLVLLDIILPKKDGYEVLDELKKNPETKSIPVILLTNLESAEDIQKAFEKGATTYLVKSSYKLEDVVKKIKETLKM
ncbi:MAG TPA: response regulator [Candidatus Moranbacteria bacterium]|nr:response regulator [Candidatus Moranbacteria bacterium]